MDQALNWLFAIICFLDLFLSDLEKLLVTSQWLTLLARAERLWAIVKSAKDTVPESNLPVVLNLTGTVRG
jgi:hypothetical protein